MAHGVDCNTMPTSHNDNTMTHTWSGLKIRESEWYKAQPVYYALQNYTEDGFGVSFKLRFSTLKKTIVTTVQLML